MALADNQHQGIIPVPPALGNGQDLPRNLYWGTYGVNTYFKASKGWQLVSAEPFLLLRDGHCFRDRAVAVCDRARLHPQIVFESGQFSSLLSMVGSGMGVSIVPEMAIEKKSRCRFVRIADDQAVRTIGAVILRGRSLTRAHNAFLSHVGARSPHTLS